MTEALRQQIANLVTDHRVVLFMKGTRHRPQCGFSAQVVQILDGLLPSYETVDVLSSAELRDAIKAFSEWPTLPQLYVDGQFIGGCDIVRELNASGALHELLGVQSPTPPAITLSPAAVRAIHDAAGPDGEPLHLQIDSQFHYDLFFGPREPVDLQIDVSGVALLLDRASLPRASGLHIDFVDGPSGGFRITNPNEPPKVKQLSPLDLKGMLERGEITLFDVRPEGERALAKIDGAHALDEEGQAYLEGLDRAAPIVFHCHHGMRSQSYAQHMIGRGFRNLYNLAGGIDAWSQTVDPSVPRY